jgi:formylglycine-generating enzyme required for sulfatase activity
MKSFASAFVLLGVCLSVLGLAAEPPAREPGQRFRDCPTCPEMIVVPHGTFMMGASPSEAGRSDRDTPLHLVGFEKDFAVGMYPVTRAEYANFARQTHDRSSGCELLDGQRRWRVDGRRDWRRPGFKQTDRDPAVCVSWDDAQRYVRWLNSIQPFASYRLISEAEWEYVARAGTHTTFYWGDEADHDFANYGAEQCYPCGVARKGRDRWDYTSPVGSFPPNAFGLYDVTGNVWQWTQDCMHDSYIGAPMNGAAWEAGDCRDRVLRGGSWLDPPRFLRLAERNPWPQDHTDYANGFRIARSLP